MRRRGKGFVLAAGLAISGSAGAEVLDITGEFAANYRAASLLRSLHVDRFGGQDGPMLAIAIERALADAPFALLAGRAGREQAEGTLAGALSTSVEEEPYTRTDKKCVEKNEKGKCVKEAKVEVRCRRREIRLNANLRLAHDETGRILYSVAVPWSEDTSWCRGESPNRSVEDAVSAGIASIADAVRRDIAPRIETYRIRLRESTKGMSKDGAGRFRSFITLSKRDPRAACAGWDAMRVEAAGHPSLVFNLALCAEQSGDYAGALALYRDATRAGATEAKEGAARAAQLIAGREDAMIRAGWR